jgi:CDP-glucose 4,6-dehydratase
MTAQTDGMTEFWRGRRVLLTGHTGFKGTWLSLWLARMGAEVTGYALAPSTEPNLWTLLNKSVDRTTVASGVIRSVIGDVRDSQHLAQTVAQVNPQIVIHMAAQALVKQSFMDPVGTFATNVMGTAILLQVCRSLKDLQCVIVVTSDKVYENHGEGRAFNENDRLGGHDPYSNSKACTELLTMSYRDSFYADGPPVATVRAGNVIGGGDWSADRIIPDCVRAMTSGSSVKLRYPEAVRPWQHVLEPLSGYLALAQALVQSPATMPRAVNFGPDPASFCTVREVVEAFGSRFEGKPPWVVDSAAHPPEAQALTLSSALARRTLGWRPSLDIRETLSWTADWYLAHSAGENMLAFCESQISHYRGLIRRSP